MLGESATELYRTINDGRGGSRPVFSPRTEGINFLPFYITRATIMPGLKKGQVEKSGCLEKSAELQAVREIRGRMQHLKMPQSFV